MIKLDFQNFIFFWNSLSLNSTHSGKNNSKFFHLKKLKLNLLDKIKFQLDCKVYLNLLFFPKDLNFVTFWRIKFCSFNSLIKCFSQKYKM